jgi:hypothetical protein
MQRIREFKEKLRDKVLDDAQDLAERGLRDYLKGRD